MGLEEQQEERGVLDSIFPEEITGTRVFLINYWKSMQILTIASLRS
jgi:hypothetical protein